VDRNRPFVPAIERIARYLRTPPVDLAGAARTLGIELIERRLPDRVSGKIQRAGDGYRIVVNAAHDRMRRRFTLAHELAHYLLHRDLVRDEVVDDDRYRSGALPEELEVQASRFAADLLMPSPLVAELAASGPVDPDVIARRFDVSRAVAATRLRELRISEPA
jgi:Zn-dependent peptidase ImmA (M78 family)